MKNIVTLLASLLVASSVFAAEVKHEATSTSVTKEVKTDATGHAVSEEVTKEESKEESTK
ncbi:MAG: hypothetical protein V4485_01075 [Pseudomonadota bacterium]